MNSLPNDARAAVALLRAPPPPHEAFTAAARGAFRVTPARSADGALWAALLEHPEHGTLAVEAFAGLPPQARAGLRIDPYLPADYVLAKEALDIAAAQGALRVSTRIAGVQLYPRKRLLRATCLVAGTDTVGVLDEAAQRLWGTAALEDELAHDGPLDIEALYSLHVVRDERAGRVLALRTHGLAKADARDFDVYLPHASFGADQELEPSAQRRIVDSQRLPTPLSEVAFKTLAAAWRDATTRDLVRALALRSLESYVDAAAWRRWGLAADEAQKLTLPDASFSLCEHTRAQFVLLSELHAAQPGGPWLSDEGADARMVVCEPASVWRHLFGRRYQPLRLFQRPFEHRIVVSSVLTGVLHGARSRASASLFAELVEQLVPEHRPFAAFEPEIGKLSMCSVKGMKNGRFDVVHRNRPEGSREASALYDLDALRFWSIPTLQGTVDVDHLSIARRLAAR